MTSSQTPRLCQSGTKGTGLALPSLGPIAIIAPHPDDETLGCGGLLALCATLQVPVTIIAMTDGEASHPGSLQTSPQQLVELRALEREHALQALGAQAARVERLGLPDGGMHALAQHASERCVSQLGAILRRDRIRTVFVTAADDDHADHRASHALTQRALSALPRMNLLTYAVWPPEHPARRANPCDLDIASVQQRKAHAITCFTSQRGEVVVDDPTGFVMPAALLERAHARHERYHADQDHRNPFNCN